MTSGLTGSTSASNNIFNQLQLSLPALPTTGTYTIVIDYCREATGTIPLEVIA